MNKCMRILIVNVVGWVIGILYYIRKEFFELRNSGNGTSPNKKPGLIFTRYSL